MKARHYLFSLAALLALAACSDSVTDEASASTDSDSTGNSYMAVTLSMASTVATRASYAYGTEAESNILVSNDYSIFLFYDTEGNYVTSGEFSGETSTYISPTSTTDSTDSGFNGVSGTHTVALGPTSSIPEEGLQLLVVLNYPGDDITDLKYLSLTEAIAQVVTAKAASVTIDNADTDFYLMTSALCYSDSKLVSTTSITSEKIFDSATDAANSPVDVYVEREVAKVQVSMNSDNFTSVSVTENGSTVTRYAALITNNAEDLKTAANIKYKSSSDNASNVQLRVVVEGWDINATNSTGYVFKNSDDDWSTSDYLATGWYDTSVGGRYFWAKDMNYDYSSSSTSYTGISYLSYSDVTATSTDAAYYHENTAVDSEGNQSTLIVAGQSAVLPTLLVAGKLQISTNSGSTWDDIDDALYEKDGMYYSLDGVKAVLADYITAAGYYWLENSTYTAISGDDFADIEFELAAADNSSRVKVSSVTMKAPSTLTSPSLVLKGDSNTTVAENVDSTNGTEIVDSSSTTYETAQKDFIAALNNTALLAITEGDSSSGLQCFAEGMCYYQAPIEHMTVEGTTYYGMVRNTWYSLTINSITHVGAPVYDDKEELEVIPGEETYYYINLSLNVLSWLDASDQTIDF